MSAIRLAIAVCLAVLAVSPAQSEPVQSGPAFAPAPWLEDLDQLRDVMSAGYPNLEWQVERGMDLPGTYARARGRLEQARDPFEAQRALERFVAAFGDGHLDIQWSRPPGTATAQAQQTLCQRLGYVDHGDAGSIAARLPGFQTIGPSNALLTTGVVVVEGRRIGVLRLPLFMPQGFPVLCEEAARRLALKPDDPCDEVCQDLLSRATDANFIHELQAAVSSVAAANVDVLLVDIAGNGGGNDSAIALVRMLTSQAMATPRVGFMRTEPWAAQLASMQADIRASLGNAKGQEADTLRRYDAALIAARAEAAKPCDRSALWTGQQSGCSMIVTGTLFAGGLSPEPLDGVRDRSWAETVSATARFPAISPLWRGPVIVLVDGASASSSELFAAMMQDAHAALIVGAPTYGSGCGHMTEAKPVTLRNSRAVVSMPDCLRLRADGSNEVAGVQPDLLIGFRKADTSMERYKRLERALPLAVSRVLAKNDAAALGDVGFVPRKTR